MRLSLAVVFLFIAIYAHAKPQEFSDEFVIDETFDDPLDDSPSEVNEANISVGGITGKTKLKASNNFVKANAQSATQAKEQKVPNQYKRYTNINTGESSGYSSCDRLL
ncbi:unnamed protein product [Leptidea sinapis]|uniref:Uncharacterized protein n=1 Tax=Leptidea sinapis TaxID=189913 RepID=A0A5E4PU41_9NEOP|nr:unnamed protein product [Leptidea sinapis]